MKIIKALPPNFPAILKVFSKASGPGVIFAYAPDIYSMYMTEIPDHLKAHERVHIKRQEAYEGGVEAWWARYLVDARFRYFEELLAHVAEYKHLIEYAPSRNLRRSALKEVSKKLAAALYGGMVTASRAADDISGIANGKGIFIGPDGDLA